MFSLFKAGLSGLLFFSLTSLYALEIDNPLMKGRVGLKYAAGDFIGNDQNYLEADLFIPISKISTCVTFGELKGYRFENGKYGFSGGIALRTKTWNKHIAGINLFYDSKGASFNRNLYSRLGVGFEWLTRCYDIRLNGYFPLCKYDRHSRKHVYNYFGGAVITCKEREVAALEGFDFELGTPLCFACAPSYGFSTYTGLGTYFYRFQHKDNYWGGMARIKFDWRTVFGLEMKTSYDVENKGTFQAIVSISLPFEWFMCERSPCEKRSLVWQPVERNGVIFTKKDCCFTSNF